MRLFMDSPTTCATKPGPPYPKPHPAASAALPTRSPRISRTPRADRQKNQINPCIKGAHRQSCKKAHTREPDPTFEIRPAEPNPAGPIRAGKPETGPPTLKLVHHNLLATPLLSQLGVQGKRGQVTKGYLQSTPPMSKVRPLERPGCAVGKAWSFHAV